MYQSTLYFIEMSLQTELSEHSFLLIFNHGASPKLFFKLSAAVTQTFDWGGILYGPNAGEFA